MKLTNPSFSSFDVLFIFRATDFVFMVTNFYLNELGDKIQCLLFFEAALDEL
ncbi:MAG: hypothetical protein JNK20_09575 [Flavipsychrobacter sp.]|nr:hypothetical protein [Flavipsychrobacter sp.]